MKILVLRVATLRASVRMLSGWISQIAPAFSGVVVLEVPPQPREDRLHLDRAAVLERHRVACPRARDRRRSSPACARGAGVSTFD